MSKRARYTGPFDEVRIGWPPGETRPSEQQTWIVERNKWLPDDVPAKLRDELLKSDDWSPVEQSDSPKEGGK
jgi:hypothetical protein